MGFRKQLIEQRDGVYDLAVCMLASEPDVETATLRFFMLVEDYDVSDEFAHAQFQIASDEKALSEVDWPDIDSF